LGAANDLQRRPFLLRLGEFVRFSHTVFALPFALIAFFVAGKGKVSLPLLGWVLVCMVTARTAAMCFNRLVDWDFDRKNPRTALRHTLIRRETGWAVFAICLAGVFFGAWKINWLCWVLSPLCMAVLLAYSLMKRVTAYSHLVLGLALGLAPIGAWMAVRGEMSSPTPYVLGVAVLCWTFGFDLIYATLDVAYDRSVGLFSFPARYGVPAALRLARLLHGGAFLGFVGFGWVAHLGWGYALACGVTLYELVQQHRLARNADAGSINRAFFTANAIVSVALLVGAAVDVFGG
jgi:4-hydroxybenzoate polyprenyltransferase